MRLRRWAVRAMAVATVVAGLGLVTAGPAAATEELRGRWVPYGDTYPVTVGTSRWSCTAEKPVVSNVKAQICAVRTADGRYVQGAVIIRNDRSGLFRAAVALMMKRETGPWDRRWTCPNSGVGAHSWSVCFGDSFYSYADFVKVAQSGINGTHYGESPWI
jgi:hypothetical protein